MPSTLLRWVPDLSPTYNSGIFVLHAYPRPGVPGERLSRLARRIGKGKPLPPEAVTDVVGSPGLTRLRLFMTLDPDVPAAVAYEFIRQLCADPDILGVVPVEKPRPRKQRPRKRGNEAEWFLYSLLGHGDPVPVAQIKRLAAIGPMVAGPDGRARRAAGLSMKQLERAKGKMGIESVHIKEFQGAWAWQMPTDWPRHANPYGPRGT